MHYKDHISWALSRIGLLRILESLPSEPGVVVFLHHRIGDRDQCEYSRDIFSATAEQFEYQIAYIKRHLPILLPHELAEIMSKKKRLTRLHAMITFDDGYLDNYTLAFKLLEQYSVPAAFFLVSAFVGTKQVPWWDEIAYLLRHTTRSQLSLDALPGKTIDLHAGRERAIDQATQAYKSKDNPDPAAFMQQLREETQVHLPETSRRFINWEEAREMSVAGMEICSHTHTHPILSRLNPLHQQEELRACRTIFEQNLGTPVTALAYPNGTLSDFTPETQQIAKDSGYDIAFSFYGGINPATGGDRYNILRRTPLSSPQAFRAELVMLSCLGNRKPAVQYRTSSAQS